MYFGMLTILFHRFRAGGTLLLAQHSRAFDNQYSIMGNAMGIRTS
jgi:hypothetical protein